MIKFLKENWKFLLFVLITGLIGGYFAGLYLPDTLTEEMLIQLKEQNITKEIFLISMMYQYGILYGLIFAILGIIISKKTNLWKKFKYEKKAAIATIVITVISGLLLFPGDKLIFGTHSSWVNDLYIISPSLSKIITGLLVGGVIEEVLMRLFFMSLIVLLITKLFYKNEKNVPLKVFIIANIISAILFASGHIPSTIAMTTLTPLLIFRCFLFNGGIGLCFGYLYRKYGIGYAMIAHGGSHLISDILMIIFI